MNEPFFILSSGRSGSTLLASMLNMHPSIHVPVELFGLYSALPQQLKHFGDLSVEHNLRLMCRNLQFIGQLNEFGVVLDQTLLLESVRPTKRRLADVIAGFYHALLRPTGKKRIGDKTPNNSPFVGAIADVFPTVRVIHLIRDGRDALASSLRSRTGINHRNAFELGGLWARNNLRLAKFGRERPLQYLRVHYEQLIVEPETELQRICAFLGERYCSDMLHFQSGEFARRNVSTLAHHANLSADLLRQNSGHWVSELSQAEVRIYESRARAALAQFGYLPKANPIGKPWTLAALGQVCTTASRRLLRWITATRTHLMFVASVRIKRLLASRSVANVEIAFTFTFAIG